MSDKPTREECAEFLDAMERWVPDREKHIARAIDAVCGKEEP